MGDEVASIALAKIIGGLVFAALLAALGVWLAAKRRDGDSGEIDTDTILGKIALKLKVNASSAVLWIMAAIVAVWSLTREYSRHTTTTTKETTTAGKDGTQTTTTTTITSSSVKAEQAPKSSKLTGHPAAPKSTASPAAKAP